MTSGLATRMRNARVAVCCGCVGVRASLTCAVKVNAPATVGVPLITPLLLRPSPGGSEDSSARLHVRGVPGLPPVDCSVVVGYGWPTTPSASAAEVMVSGSTTGGWGHVLVSRHPGGACSAGMVSTEWDTTAGAKAVRGSKSVLARRSGLTTRMLNFAVPPGASE